MANSLSKTTPFPNRLLDDLMPQLRDTEWRLVCVIVRQTLGWSDGTGRRKEEDWLTHTQLRRRTNRAAAAVSQSVERLANLQVIQVRNGAGRIVSTAGERRRTRSKLYFRLHPRLLQDTGETPSAHPNVSDSEIQKPKTTKETGTKVKESSLLSSKTEDVGGAAPLRIASVKNPPIPGHMAAEIEAFVPEFNRLYSSQFGQEPPASSDVDLALLSQRLGLYGSRQLIQRLPKFFSSNLSYAVRHRHSLESFLNSTSVLEFTPEAENTGALE